jgi:RNA-binding protein YlmH
MKASFNRDVLRCWQDREMSLLAAHILDKCDLAVYTQTIQVTPFIPQVMKEWTQSFLTRHNLSYFAEGGFPEAERVRLAIAPSGFKLTAEDALVTVVWAFSANQAERLEHRQVLGSLMSMGLKREVIGDIRHGQIGVYVAATREIAVFLINNWNRIGKSFIAALCPDGELRLQPDQGEVLRITVASPRLDAVLAGGFRVSRSLARNWIGQGKVKRNDLPVLKNETEVRTGDTISCRGQGRLSLGEAKPTRKGRITWIVTAFKAKRQKRDDYICQ